MTWRVFMFLAGIAAGAAVFVIGRRRVKRAARARRRAERVARRARSGGRPHTPRAIPQAGSATPEAGPAEVPDAPADHAGSPTAAADGPGPVRTAPGFQSIRGVGPAMEERLRAAGVTAIEEIAAWSDADVEALAPVLHVTPERVRSQAWIEQARTLLDAASAR